MYIYTCIDIYIYICRCPGNHWNLSAIVEALAVPTYTHPFSRATAPLHSTPRTYIYIYIWR